ncbi:MAG TPA: hypothetical protein VFB06_05705 [Streptosporangiaceae bacterium]|nr:hypothetical protein [Streptosporangiaceae bacterium]
MRSAITGLLFETAAAEQTLLLEDGSSAGTPDDWAAVPLVAHCVDFKDQQSERLSCLLAGTVPPQFGEVDHRSDSLYQALSARPADEVLADSRRVTAALIDGLWAVADDDLTDPSRHPWLNGRMLWLQIVVRGFWHPMGHLGDYYLSHGQAERAVAMQSHALATARYLAIPAPAEGMAAYNLACALARAGFVERARATLSDAISLNADLTANAGRDPDLTAVRG